jgi:hypothetical protein
MFGTEGHPYRSSEMAAILLSIPWRRLSVQNVAILKPPLSVEIPHSWKQRFPVTSLHEQID